MIKMRHFKIVFSIFLYLLALPSFQGLAQGKWIGLETKWVAADLEKYFSIPDIAKTTEQQVPWRPGTKEIITFGLKAKRYWARSVLKNPTSQKKLAIIELQANYYHTIDMYIVNGQGNIEQRFNGGSSRRNGSYLFNSSYPSVMVELEPGEEKTYLLHIYHYGTINLPLKLYDSKTQISSEVLESLSKHTLFYGTILIMITLSIIFYISIKNSIFLFYSFSIFFHRVLPQASLDGTLQRFLKDVPFITERGFPLTTSIGFFLSAIFFKRMLKSSLTKFHLKVIDFYQTLNALVFIAVCIFPHRSQLLLNVSLEWSFMIFATLFSYQCYKKSNSIAKYFVISNPVIIFFTVINFLKFIGILPNNQFSNHYFQVGFMIEMLLLGMALAEVYNTISIENINQKVQMLEQQQQSQLKKTVLSNLSKQVKVAAQLSDKLNSPILVLFNSHETLDRKWKMSLEAFHQSWEKVRPKIQNALEDLQEVSRALESMKENDIKLLKNTENKKLEETYHNNKDALI